jgi:hypothetical protein
LEALWVASRSFKLSTTPHFIESASALRLGRLARALWLQRRLPEQARRRSDPMMFRRSTVRDRHVEYINWHNRRRLHNRWPDPIVK